MIRTRRFLCTLLALSFTLCASAATRHNDDSCDISVLPAATLLLPYFEVDLDDPNGETTLFTITNVTNLDAIARVTLWTDRAYPVFTFNLYLTGYDVQAISLHDVLARGLIAPDAGTGTAVTKRGKFSDPSPSLDLTQCAALPKALDAVTLERLHAALTNGAVPEGCGGIGGTHENAVGYATIDVVANCASTGPGEAAYWDADLRYDNVLIGDYQQVARADDFAQGGPLVHIRAVPEGGTSQERRNHPTLWDAGFTRTFYSRYQSSLSPRLDGRQPLPSQFAVRWTRGGELQTSLKIWREGRATANAPCPSYVSEGSLAVREIVTFDDRENAAGAEGLQIPPASRTEIADDAIYPPLPNGGTNGWLYLNLDRSSRDLDATQGWVIASMRADGRYSADFDATALGNGCSAPAAATELAASPGAPIAPAANVSPRHGLASTDNDDSCDISLLPAATLLLPYFEVDFADPRGETTIFTITNVGPKDQIARVTLWTDYSFPVITFNIYLTGYDVQSVNLYDVLARGQIAPPSGTGTSITARGPYSDLNGSLDLDACERLSGTLPEAWLTRMQFAFVEGTVPDLGALAGCNNVGNEHENAVGYATIDVVTNCDTTNPTTSSYWTRDIAWDNVLIGDSQQVHAANDYAQGATMVHIRAVPEGGTHAERNAAPEQYETGFAQTFYGRFQAASSPRRDGRQPLPTLFAARWIDGGPSGFQTFLKIWRDGVTPGARTCSTWDDNVQFYSEVLRFDEAENVIGDASSYAWCYGLTWEFHLPTVSLTSVADTFFYPPPINGATSGWLYVNLDSRGACAAPHRDQSWVVTSMRAEGRFSVDMDAAALGNGCSPEVSWTEVTAGTETVGPRPNRNP